MKKAIVYGAGVSGKGAINLLTKVGYSVMVVDDKIGITKEEMLESVGEYDLLIKSPGIPNENSLIEEAKKLGIKIWDEIELAFNYSDYKIVAITGTNGKTTTVTKMTELLRAAGYKAEYAGNIGNSFAELVCRERELDYVVLELSSYQLEYLENFRAEIAMIINLTPDHLNRYDSLNDYYMAKFNIFKNQEIGDYALMNFDDKAIIELEDRVNFGGEKIYLSQHAREDVYVKFEKIYYGDLEVLEIEKLGLKGIHNLENSLFLVAVAKILEIENSVIRSYLYTTSGLAHRTEKFFRKQKIDFINDSKGTNLDATIKAIDSFDGEIVLICGGKDKKLDLTTLSNRIVEKVEHLYLIGETANEIEKLVIDLGYEESRVSNLKTVEAVVDELYESLDITKKQVVLFSPAASSFDQFKNFEERGDIFKSLIKERFNG